LNISMSVMWTMKIILGVLFIPFLVMAETPDKSLNQLKKEYLSISKTASDEMSKIDLEKLSEKTVIEIGVRLRDLSLRKLNILALAINRGFLGVGRPLKDMEAFLGTDLKIGRNMDGSLIIGQINFLPPFEWETTDPLIPIKGVKVGWTATVFIDADGIVENVYFEEPGNDSKKSKFDFRNPGWDLDDLKSKKE
jgi:hypothetical protein